MAQQHLDRPDIGPGFEQGGQGVLSPLDDLGV